MQTNSMRSSIIFCQPKKISINAIVRALIQLQWYPIGCLRTDAVFNFIDELKQISCLNITLSYQNIFYFAQFLHKKLPAASLLLKNPGQKKIGFQQTAAIYSTKFRQHLGIMLLQNVLHQQQHEHRCCQQRYPQQFVKDSLFGLNLHFSVNWAEQTLCFTLCCTVIDAATSSSMLSDENFLFFFGGASLSRFFPREDWFFSSAWFKFENILE